MQLEVSDLVFSYGEADVLKSVSFCADRGERIAVLGPNGVGKSTLFRCLLGFLEPKRGSVKIAGRDVRDYSRRALAVKGTGEGFRKGMVRAFRRLAEHMSSGGSITRSDGPWRAARAV